jgi:hypothetical protein
MPFSIIIALWCLIKSISYTKVSKGLYGMHESSLDLFCNHENQNEIDNAFDKALMELAEEQGVSLEYFIMEFM